MSWITRRDRSVYVSGFDDSISDEEIYNLFASIGPVEKVVIKRDTLGSPNNAIIVFRDDPTLERALGAQHKIRGTCLTLRPYRSTRDAPNMRLDLPRQVQVEDPANAGPKSAHTPISPHCFVARTFGVNNASGVISPALTYGHHWMRESLPTPPSSAPPTFREPSVFRFDAPRHRPISERPRTPASVDYHRGTTAPMTFFKEKPDGTTLGDLSSLRDNSAEFASLKADDPIEAMVMGLWNDDSKAPSPLSTASTSPGSEPSIEARRDANYNLFAGSEHSAGFFDFSEPGKRDLFINQQSRLD